MAGKRTLLDDFVGVDEVDDFRETLSPVVTFNIQDRVGPCGRSLAIPVVLAVLNPKQPATSAAIGAVGARNLRGRRREHLSFLVVHVLSVDDAEYDVLAVLELNVTLSKLLAEGFDNLIEVSDELTLDDKLIAGHLKLQVLVNRLRDGFSLYLIHLGLFEQLEDDIHDERAFLESQLFQDAEVLCENAAEQVVLYAHLCIALFILVVAQTYRNEIAVSGGRGKLSCRSRHAVLDLHHLMRLEQL